MDDAGRHALPGEAHVFISYSRKDSVFVDRLEAELNQRKPVVPVLPLDCPDDLELISFQHVDFRHSFKNALPRLLAEIERLRGGGAAPLMINY